MENFREDELESLDDGVSRLMNDEEEGENTIPDDQSKERIYFDLALKNAIAIFRDQYGEPYAVLPDDQRSCVKIVSKHFFRWLSHLIMTQTGKHTGRETFYHVIAMLEGYALYRSSQYSLDVRIVSRDESIWYDLGNGSGVKIAKDGWAITRELPIAFRTHSHQKAQVEPVREGDIQEILGFLNVPRSGAGITSEQLLLLVWMVFAFIPDYPHPILTLHGPQGSAKTTAFKILKKLIDPSQMETLSLPDSQREFVQLAFHHYFVAFDNLTNLSFDYSDLLCRIVTGDGFSKRALFSNDDDIVYSYKRVIGLNGINITASKADLLDRSLLIGFERIKQFETEKSFWKRFEDARPRILGAIFETLSKALKIADSMEEPGNYRMADFVRFGMAIAEAMGFPKEEFLAAYQKNMNAQNGEALSASPIASAIMRLMEYREAYGNVWQGTPTELLEALNMEALPLGIDTKARTWPKDPRWVWRRIQEIKPNLERVGIRVEWHAMDGKTISIQKDPENVQNVESVGDEPTDAT